MSVLIHVVDAQTDELLDYVTEEEYWDDNLEQSIENQLDAFEFTTFATSPFAEHLTKRNRIVIPNHYGVLSEYIIEENEQNIDREKTVYATASYIELAKVRWIPPGDTQAVGVKQHAEAALLDTEWTLGEAPEVGTTKFTFEEYTDALSYLRAVADAFDLELSFHVEHNGYQITKRVVDFNVVDREFEGYEVVFGKDAQEITRTERSADVVTKLIGLGPNPSEEDAERLVVEVEDLEALERWGRGGKHLIGLFTPEGNGEGTTIEQLYEQTRKRLDELINSQVTYDVQFVNLYDIFGMDRRMTLGEVVRVKDEYFNPPLYVDARVHTISGSIKDGGVRSIALGDFIEYAQSDIMAYFNALRGEVNGKLDEYQLYEYVGMYAEKKIIKSAIPPTDLDAFWLDTSVVPNVFKSWNGTEWVKATPTEAKEVGAITEEEAASLALKGALEAEQHAMMTTFLDVKAAYQSAYNSVYILGLPIQESVQTSYDAFVTAHDTLYNLITDVLADGVVNDAEKASIDSTRESYQTALETVLGVLGEASEEIRTADKASQESFVQEYYGKRVSQGEVQPTNPSIGDLWIDLSVSPYVWRRWDGTQWVEAIATSIEQLQGELDGARVKVGTIKDVHIDELSIDTTHLKLGAVTSEKLADLSVEAGKLADSSVTATKIANLAVGSAAIQEAAIKNAHIEALDAGKITTGYLLAERIEARSLSADKLAANSITASEIKALTITSNELATGAVTASKIYAGAVTADAIAAQSITSTMIAAVGLDAGVIKFGTMSGERILANSITGDKITGGVITGVTINVDTDLTVGRNITMSGSTGGVLRFPTGAVSCFIGASPQGDMTIEAFNSLAVVALSMDFSNVSTINWGSNKPVAVWG